MSYDLKITGGTIVDGTGAARYLGDLGIKDGRIVAMGDAPAEAQQTICLLYTSPSPRDS